MNTLRYLAIHIRVVSRAALLGGLCSLNWSNLTSSLQDNGTTEALIVMPPDGNRFNRLLGN